MRECSEGGLLRSHLRPRICGVGPVFLPSSCFWASTRPADPVVTPTVTRTSTPSACPGARGAHTLPRPLLSKVHLLPSTGAWGVLAG